MKQQGVLDYVQLYFLEGPKLSRNWWTNRMLSVLADASGLFKEWIAVNRQRERDFQSTVEFPYPRCSMYGIFTYIWDHLGDL